MHEIQKHILKKLALNKKSRYSDLKPQRIEGNLFSYHLKTLIREGYLALSKGTYILTAAGRQFVDRVSFETFRERIQPKIVTLLVIERDGKYLLYRRKRSPFINRIGFPYGKIHLEERLDEAAERELQEKTGLLAELRHRGDVYISVHDETELVSHMLCHVFTGSNPTGELRTESDIGGCFWAKLDSVPKNELIPGVIQIARLLKKHPAGKKTNTSVVFFDEFFLNIGDE